MDGTRHHGNASLNCFFHQNQLVTKHLVNRGTYVRLDPLITTSFLVLVCLARTFKYLPESGEAIANCSRLSNPSPGPLIP